MRILHDKDEKEENMENVENEHMENMARDPPKKNTKNQNIIKNEDSE